ncbi:MAG: endolytic transglycosylase MltG [Candidatus Moranbacteria bacterium]|nr:endolytic transglycosylase MltG [Candidatus Moranbacteria bacterium]
MSKNKIVIFVVALLLVLVLGVFFFFNRVNHSVGSLESGVVEFEIFAGENLFDVGESLEKNGLIAGEIYFTFFVWKENLRSEIKAGEYEIGAGMTIPEIAYLITRPKEAIEDHQKKITFPEGWDAKKMQSRLASNGLAVDDFLELFQNPSYFEEKYGYDFLSDLPQKATLEGYLFPDTYFFATDATSEEIIKKMLDNFDQKISQDLRDEIKKQGKSLHEIVIMGSLIEREVQSDEDKKTVGGIFWNRIEVGQALQSCATLAYILGESKEQYSYEDTQIESFYNTYLYPGLPPGPIAAPGLSSIEAAVYPDETDYNYFLTSQKTGETIFSKTLDEHNLNKVRHGL